MLLVITSCLPAISISSLIYGYGIIKNITYSVLFAIILEFFCLKLRDKSFSNSIATLLDCSAILTAILFAMCLPPDFSLFKIFIGMIFAIVVAKHLYGGLGHNIFNPAMVGYLVLLVSFPVDFTNWTMQDNILEYFTNLTHFSAVADDITQATPLDPIFTKNIHTLYNIYAINIAWLLGGLYLVYKRIVPLVLPLGFLLGLFITSSVIFTTTDNILYSPFQQLLLGSTMIAAFFIITDPVTAAVNTTGKFIYSFLAGLLCCLIREFGSYPDGVGFAILFMNSLVPLINKMTAETNLIAKLKKQL